MPQPHTASAHANDSIPCVHMHDCYTYRYRFSARTTSMRTAAARSCHGRCIAHKVLISLPLGIKSHRWHRLAPARLTYICCCPRTTKCTLDMLQSMQHVLATPLRYGLHRPPTPPICPPTHPPFLQFMGEGQAMPNNPPAGACLRLSRLPVLPNPAKPALLLYFTLFLEPAKSAISN